MKNTMTAIDLDRLEALANKATPGPWRYADSEDHVTITGFIFAGFDDLFTLQRDSAQGVMDAEFIAAANPQTILALIARIRELEAAQTWRPISSANIDAGNLLLWQERRGVQMGKFNKDEYAKKPRPFWEYDSDHRITRSRDSQPTHYMPLPPPPKMEE